MASSKKPHFGSLSPKYNFVFNPYPDMRISRCPFCESKTGQRKVPLFIHVDPMHLISMNYTCRFCGDCDLLIAHKNEVEHLLTDLFRQLAPDAIGNSYLVIGTMEKKTWREGLTQPNSIEKSRANVHDFKTCYQDLRVTRPGWYKADQKPPIMEPPPSQEWLKTKPS